MNLKPYISNNIITTVLPTNRVCFNVTAYALLLLIEISLMLLISYLLKYSLPGGSSGHQTMTGEETVCPHLLFSFKCASMR